MKLKAKEIIKIMNDWASPSLIDSWDNTGFQVGDSNREVERILIALDVDSFVLEKAIKEDFQMIITHHPLIFQPMKSITNLTYKEKLIYDLIRNEIVVYNAHTNLDQAKGGVNDELGKLLGLKTSEVLRINDKDEIKSYGYGKIGYIEDTRLLDYLEVIKKKLDTNHLIVYGETNRIIKKIAVCGGSGSSFIEDAYEKGACLYITGDIKYHEAQLANELGLSLVDAGHYHTEKIILPVIKKYLNGKNANLYIEIWDKSSPTYDIY